VNSIKKEVVMTLRNSFKQAAAIAVTSFMLGSNSASAAFVGYMNWFEPDCTTYVAGGGWGVGDLKASGTTSIELSPNTNTYDDNLADAYWVDQVTGAGAKCMQANYYEETVYPVLPADTTVSMSGWVDTNTLTGHSAVAVVKVFDGANNFIFQVEDALVAGGAYSVEVDLSGRAGENLKVQTGFTMVGPNVAGTSAEAAQKVELRVGADNRLGASSAADDPTGIPVLPLWALFGLAGLIGLMGLRRKA
jgi:hypothetical protein